MSSDGKQAQTRDPVEESIRMRRAALAERIAEARERIGAHQTQHAQQTTKDREPKDRNFSISGEHGIATLARVLPRAEARPSTPPPAPPARPSMLYASEPIIRRSSVTSTLTAASSRGRVLLVPVLAIAASAVSYWAVSAWVSSASAVKQASADATQRTSSATQSSTQPLSQPLTQPLTQPLVALGTPKQAATRPQHPHAMPAAIAVSAITQDIRRAPIASAPTANAPAGPKHATTPDRPTRAPRATGKDAPEKVSPAPFERIAMGSFPAAADGGGEAKTGEAKTGEAKTHDANRPALQVIVPVSTTEQPRAARSVVTARADELTIGGSLHAGGVQRALDRILPQLAACESTLNNGARSGVIRVEMLVDVVGRVRNPLVSGAPSLELERCLSTATAKFVSKPPDTGTARVSWRLRFTQ